MKSFRPQCDCAGASRSRRSPGLILLEYGLTDGTSRFRREESLTRPRNCAHGCDEADELIEEVFSSTGGCAGGLIQEQRNGDKEYMGFRM